MVSQNIVRKNDDHKVTYAELFFDLVFVLAIILISHALVEHFDTQGIIQTLFLLLCVWWIWIYTSWATNWLDAQKTPVRIMLFALMLAGLLFTTSIPDAFGSKAILFASTYVFIQLGRSLFMLWAFQKDPIRCNNFIRISIWFAFSGIFWIAGALIQEYRLLIWLLALAIEYLSPVINIWVPFMGKSKSTEWNIKGAHMAERCSLFIIIALGETILVMGRSFTSLEWNIVNSITLVIIFLTTVVFWWIYFNIGAERGSKNISESEDPGRIGRLSYTYIHILIVAGILFFAAAAEIVLLHPTDTIKPIALLAVIGGPAIYLLGNLLFKQTTSQWFSKSHVVGIVLLGALAYFHHYFNALVISVIVLFILSIVVLWEAKAYASCHKCA